MSVNLCPFIAMLFCNCFVWEVLSKMMSCPFHPESTIPKTPSHPSQCHAFN